MMMESNSDQLAAGIAAWLEFFDPTALFDSQMDVTLDEPGVTFAGFAHLAGRMVSVIADGYWLDSLAVGDDGVLTLSDAATLPVTWPPTASDDAPTTWTSASIAWRATSSGVWKMMNVAVLPFSSWPRSLSSRITSATSG